jgi:hypothetical protein
LEVVCANDLCRALAALRAVEGVLALSWHGRARDRFLALYVGWADQLAVYGYDLVAIAVFLRAVADEYRRLDGALRTLVANQALPAGLTGDSLRERYAAATCGAPYWALDTYGNLRSLTPAERIAYCRALEAQRDFFETLLELLQFKVTSKDGALAVRLGLSASGQAEAEPNPLGGLNRQGAYSYLFGMELGRANRAGVFFDASVLQSSTQHLLLGSEAFGLTFNHGGRVMGFDAFLGAGETAEGGLAAGASTGVTLLSLYLGLGLNVGGRNYGLYAAGGLQAKVGGVAGSDRVSVDAGPISFGLEIKDALDDEPWLDLDPATP